MLPVHSDEAEQSIRVQLDVSVAPLALLEEVSHLTHGRLPCCTLIKQAERSARKKSESAINVINSNKLHKVSDAEERVLVNGQACVFKTTVST